MLKLSKLLTRLRHPFVAPAALKNHARPRLTPASAAAATASAPGTQTKDRARKALTPSSARPLKTPMPQPAAIQTKTKLQHLRPLFPPRGAGLGLGRAPKGADQDNSGDVCSKEGSTRVRPAVADYVAPGAYEIIDFVGGVPEIRYVVPPSSVSREVEAARGVGRSAAGCAAGSGRGVGAGAGVDANDNNNNAPEAYEILDFVGGVPEIRYLDRPRTVSREVECARGGGCGGPGCADGSGRVVGAGADETENDNDNNAPRPHKILDFVGWVPEKRFLDQQESRSCQEERARERGCGGVSGAAADANDNNNNAPERYEIVDFVGGVPDVRFLDQPRSVRCEVEGARELGCGAGAGAGAGVQANNNNAPERYERLDFVGWVPETRFLDQQESQWCEVERGRGGRCGCAVGSEGAGAGVDNNAHVPHEIIDFVGGVPEIRLLEPPSSVSCEMDGAGRDGCAAGARCAGGCAGSGVCGVEDTGKFDKNTPEPYETLDYVGGVAETRILDLPRSARCEVEGADGAGCGCGRGGAEGAGVVAEAAVGEVREAEEWEYEILDFVGGCADMRLVRRVGEVGVGREREGAVVEEKSRVLGPEPVAGCDVSSEMTKPGTTAGGKEEGAPEVPRGGGRGCRGRGSGAEGAGGEGRGE